MKYILGALTALLLFVVGLHAQTIEQSVEAIDYLKTGDQFIYQNIYIPVLDATYHEFSADSITWRKGYEEGDCYVRFANVTDNSINPYTSKQGYHPSWWVFNFCTCNGAIPEVGEGGGVDTLFVYYYQSDTIYSIDTLVIDDTNLSIKFPQPETITGNTTNFNDSSYHTHEIKLWLGEIENVDTVGVTNGQVIKWNSTTSKWEAANDLLGGGGTYLTVQEVDGSPSVTNVNTINVENGHVTDNGLGSVTIDFSLEPVSGSQDFFRTDSVIVTAGDHFLAFDTPLPDIDYIVSNVYATYANQERQSLTYDSLTVNGFKVYDVLDDAIVRYLVMRNLDSLGLAVTDQGRIMASSGDTNLGYLDSKTDDSTITVTNNQLTFIGGTRDLNDVDTIPIKTGQILVWNNDSSYYGVDYNILDTTANVAFDTTHTRVLASDSISIGALHYSDTYWDDMSIPLIAAAGGANAPDLVQFRSSGIYARGFAGTSLNESVYVEGQFSHKIKETSDISPHLHVMPTTAPVATDTAVISFQYSWASVGDIFPVQDTIVFKIPVCDYSQWQHVIWGGTEDITGIGDQESSIIIGRIIRLQDNASDTYTNDLIIFNMDIHYEIDKPGSRNEIPD